MQTLFNIAAFQAAGRDQMEKQGEITRRTFVSRSAMFVAGATALSYSRVLGANDRISLATVGLGQRGSDHLWIISQLLGDKNVELAAVCDLYKPHRDRAVATMQQSQGRSPRALERFTELLNSKDIDGVTIATPDHQHATMARMAAEAGKHVYVEKPMANVLEEAKAARDAVVARPNLIVQCGTQRRSEPYQVNACEFLRTGALGDISKVEIVWNYHGPRWVGREEVKQTREQEVDWREFLLTKPYRPFDPRIYWEFRVFREFSSGIPDQWWTHAIDMVHFFMDDHFPVSAVALGGVLAWHDGRENPDTMQALFEYPKGFLLSVSTSFGNDSPSSIKFMGKNATLVNYGTEGTPRWQSIEEVGNYEDTPELKRPEKWLTLPGNDQMPPPATPDTDVSHMSNWLGAMRSGKQPSAPIQAGFAHSIACIMATRAFREGKKLYWDGKTERIVDQLPAST